jgi:hypothetical protein
LQHCNSEQAFLLYLFLEQDIQIHLWAGDFLSKIPGAEGKIGAISYDNVHVVHPLRSD